MNDAPRTRNITIRKVALGAESEAADRAYWESLGPDERVNLAWTLSVQLWEHTEGRPFEPGLCRSVARVVRR